MTLSAALELICDVSPAAAEAVTGTLYQRHPRLREAIGPRGVAACRTDIGYHIEYLCSALVAGNSVPFVEYAIWLAQVLRARQIGDAVLGESFQLLGEFLATHLDTETSQKVATILADGRAALSAKLPVPGRDLSLPETLTGESQSYLGNLLTANRKAAATAIIEQQQRGVSLVTLETRVIQPAMYELGKLWQNNRISVAEEHLATAITQAIMAEAFSHAEFAEPINRRALFANIEANYHTVGLRMVADAFETAGWEACYLGANVPTASIISQIDASKPDLIAISVTLPSQFVALAKLIETVIAEYGQHRPLILVGGLAINGMPGIAQRLGADLSAIDAEAAARIAKTFSPLSHE